MLQSMLCQNNADVNTNTNKFFMLSLFLTGDTLGLVNFLWEIYNAH